MKNLISLQTARWGIPLLILGLSLMAARACDRQTDVLETNLQALDKSLSRSPRKQALVALVASLLPSLKDEIWESAPNDNLENSIANAETRFRNAVAGAFIDLQTLKDELQVQGQGRYAVSHGAPLSLALSSVYNSLRVLEVCNWSQLTSPNRSGMTSLDARRQHWAALIQGARNRVISLIADLQPIVDPITAEHASYNAGMKQLQRLYWVKVAFIVAGLILSAAVFAAMEFSFWRPLAQLQKTLELVAERRYTETPPPCGVPEVQKMFESLVAICNRGVSNEMDRDQEVAGRSNQKVRSERLAGIGLLATGVAHEINNPLTAIVGAADGLNWRLSDIASQLPKDDGEIVKEYLAMIVNEAKRCRSITTKLLDFARGREGERAHYDVTAIVNDVVGMFRHVRQYASREIDINRQDPVRAWCNGPEIKQVVLNLVANALQATPDGGRLQIQISSMPDTVEIMVRDSGTGMTPETLEHIFDPFFSTKGPGQGTGLGLSISHAIVEKHGGTLEAASAGLGSGSTFRLRLPATEQLANRESAEQHAA